MVVLFRIVHVQPFENYNKMASLCFINTGRALAEIDEPILQLQMDGLVCGCGTILRITIMYLLNIRYRLILVIAY